MELTTIHGLVCKPPSFWFPIFVLLGSEGSPSWSEFTKVLHCFHKELCSSLVFTIHDLNAFGPSDGVHTGITAVTAFLHHKLDEPLFNLLREILAFKSDLSMKANWREALVPRLSCFFGHLDKRLTSFYPLSVINRRGNTNTFILHWRVEDSEIHHPFIWFHTTKLCPLTTLQLVNLSKTLLPRWGSFKALRLSYATVTECNRYSKKQLIVFVIYKAIRMVIKM